MSVCLVSGVSGVWCVGCAFFSAQNHPHEHVQCNATDTTTISLGLPRAGAHAEIDPQRAHHTNSALKHNTGGTVLALASFAMRRKNMAVSADHLPPTSPARTNRALDRGPTSSGQVCSLRRRAAWSRCSTSSRSVVVECTDQRVIANCMPKDWKAFGHNFQSSAIKCLLWCWQWQVQVSRIAGSTSGEIWQMAHKQRQMPSWPAANNQSTQASPRATGNSLNWKHCATAKSARSGCPAKLGCVPTVSGAFSTPLEMSRHEILMSQRSSAP